jgi:hypothetical protein
MSIPSKPGDFGDGNQAKSNDEACGDESQNGRGDSHQSAGDALAKFDFSHVDFGPQRADHPGDIQSALASMSSDDALEYAIGQMGTADHFDAGNFDVSTKTSQDTDV